MFAFYARSKQIHKYLKLMSYKAQINQLEIRKTVLINTFELFIPTNEFNAFRAKIKAINNEIYLYKSLQYLTNFTDKGIYDMYLKVSNNINHLADICDSLNIQNYDIFKYELYKQYRDYCEQRV